MQDMMKNRWAKKQKNQTYQKQKILEKRPLVRYNGTLVKRENNNPENLKEDTLPTEIKAVIQKGQKTKTTEENKRKCQNPPTIEKR